MLKIHSADLDALLEPRRLPSAPVTGADGCERRDDAGRRMAAGRPSKVDTKRMKWRARR